MAHKIWQIMCWWKKNATLDSRINVGLRFIFGIFFQALQIFSSFSPKNQFFISQVPTFIPFGKFSMPYVYSKPNVYSLPYVYSGVESGASNLQLGLNTKIGIVQKVYKWSNCPFAKMIPPWENHFGKTTAL